MPTIHRAGPYRFFFYANENAATAEPPHVHVASVNGTAVFSLTPISLRRVDGYTRREVERIRRIVVANRRSMLEHWSDFFHPPS